MSRPGKTEYLIATGCVSAGCLAMVPPLWLVPSTISYSTSMIALNVMKPGTVIPDNDKIVALKQSEKLDTARAILATTIVLLTEVPAAIPQVLPKMSEFSSQIPNWVPEVAAVAAIVYALSWLNMRGNRKALEKKTL